MMRGLRLQPSAMNDSAQEHEMLLMTAINKETVHEQ